MPVLPSQKKKKKKPTKTCLKNGEWHMGKHLQEG